MPTERRRVLIIVQNLSVPMDRRVWLQCQALVAAGYGVSVICPRGAGEPRHRVLDDVHIHVYDPPRSTSTVLSYVREFVYCWLQTLQLSLYVLTHEGFDVIQACNPPDTYWLLARLFRPLGKRFVYDQHDLCPEVYEAKFGRRGPLHRALLFLEARTYATADHVIVTNQSYREVARRRGGLPAERLSVVTSAPDPVVMRASTPVPALRHGRPHLVCYLGIMGSQDGVDRLLLAIDHYVRALGRSDTHFGLLGFGEARERLEQLARRLGLDAFVTFAGRVELPEITRWLSTADLGVTPDPRNDFNDRSTMNKTLEYMAFGLPIVATNLRETRRSAGDAAVYVDDSDPAELARAIAGLLDRPQQRTAMGRAGRARIEAELCWQRQAPVYVAVYDALLGQPARREPQEVRA